VNHPALFRADKAQRLFEFSVPYAQTVVTKSTTQEQRKQVAAELLIRAEQGGYGLLQSQDASGKNGLAALRELLEAQRPEQLAELATTFSFDIPRGRPTRRCSPRRGPPRPSSRRSCRQALLPQPRAPCR